MMKRKVSAAKAVVIAVAALCLPLAACSKGAADKAQVAHAGKGGAKAKAADWLNGSRAKGGKQGAAPQFGAKKGGYVKIPRIGAGGGNKKDKGA